MLNRITWLLVLSLWLSHVHAIHSSIGIDGGGSSYGINFSLDGIVDKSLTLPQESVTNQTYLVDLDPTQITTNGNTLDEVETTIRYCLGEQKSLDKEYFVRIDIGDAVWESSNLYLYVEENAAKQFILQSELDVDGDGAPNVLRTEAGTNGGNVVIFSLPGQWKMEAGTCMVLGSDGYETSDGEIINTAGNPTILLKEGASGVHLYATVYETISAALNKDTVNVNETDNAFIEVVPQFTFNIIQTAEVTIDASQPEQLIDIGNADDILTSDNISDTLAAAATYQIKNNFEKIEDSILFNTNFSLNWTLKPSQGIDNVSGFIELDGDARSTVNNQKSFTVSSTSNQLYMTTGGNDLPSNNPSFEDDIVLSFDGNQEITAQSWTLAVDMVYMVDQNSQNASLYGASDAIFKTVIATPEYISSPTAFGTLYFSDNQQKLSITAKNASLLIESPEITGSDKDYFHFDTTLFPLSISTSISFGIALSCEPSTTSNRTATLTLSSNDPSLPQVSYTLVCNRGTAGYSSVPDVGETLAIKDALGTPSSTTLTISEVGNATLVISNPTVVGTDANRFSWAFGNNTTAIPDGGTPLSLHVQCTPSATLAESAQLQLDTNDTTQPTVSYPLLCAALDTNQPPQDITLSAAEIATNAPAGTVVGDFTTIDPDLDDKHTYQLLQNSLNAFRIEGNQLIYNGNIDSAGQTLTANIQVQTTDSKGETFAKNFAITINPVVNTNNAPTDISLSSTSIPVETPSGSTIGIFTTTDPDPTDSHTYRLVTDTSGFFVVSGDSLLLSGTANLAGLGDSQFNITVETQDTGGLTYEETFTINIIGTSEFTGLLTRPATGETGQTLTIHAPERFTLEGVIQPRANHVGSEARISVDYTWFPPNGGNGLVFHSVLYEAAILETRMEFTLLENFLIVGMVGDFQAELGYELTNGEKFSASIANLTVEANRSPTTLNLSNTTVLETSTVGTVIGNLSCEDADLNEHFTYGLVSGDAVFKVVDDTLQVANEHGLNWGINDSFDITLRCRDTFGGFVDQDFTIQVTPSDNEEFNISLNNDVLWENSLRGLLIGRLIVNSKYPGQAWFELSDDADGRFMVLDDLLLVNDSQLLDYEMANEHTITVYAELYNGFASGTQTFNLTLLNQIDVGIDGHVFDIAANSELEPAQFNADREVEVNLTYYPDSEHLGQEAEIFAVINVQQETQVTLLILSKEGTFIPWLSGDFADLQALKQDTLNSQENLMLWQGTWVSTGIGNGIIDVYIGYRLLNSDTLYYTLHPFTFEVSAGANDPTQLEPIQP